MGQASLGVPRMGRNWISVAAAQPASLAGQLRVNVEAHADCVRRLGARPVVFPELSLTGYELAADPIDEACEAIEPLVAACAETGAMALAGAPVADRTSGRRIFAMLFSGRGAWVVYEKAHLGEVENGRLMRGPGAKTIVQGRRVGLGICKDTGVSDHIAATAALGVDLFAAGLVHHPKELEDQDRRGAAIARACAACRSARALLRLAQAYSPVELEEACATAAAIASPTRAPSEAIRKAVN